MGKIWGEKSPINCKTINWTFFGDPGGIQTPNPQSRNLMRYSIAPRSLFLASGVIKYPTSIQLRHEAFFLASGVIKYSTSIQLHHGACNTCKTTIF